MSKKIKKVVCKMEKQFCGESIEEKPLPGKSYYVYPAEHLFEYKSDGSIFTYLMKLVLCAKEGERCIDLIKEELKKNPEAVNKQCLQGWTPLMIACGNSSTYSSTEIVRLLLETPGIDVNKRSNRGYTALTIACGYENIHPNIETIKLLLSHPNIDVNIRTNSYETALIVLFRYGRYNKNKQYINERAIIAEMLLERPEIDINAESEEGCTALVYACSPYGKSHPYTEIIRKIINHPKTHINQYNSYYALLSACGCRFSKNSCSAETMEILLVHKDINVDGVKYEKSILSSICERCCDSCIIELTKLLLKKKTITICVHDIENFGESLVLFDDEFLRLLFGNTIFDIGNLERYEFVELMEILEEKSHHGIDILTEHILNRGIHLRDEMIEAFIRKNETKYSETILSRILNPLYFNKNHVITMSEKYIRKKDQLIFRTYCKLHLYIKKKMHRELTGKRETVL